MNKLLLGFGDSWAYGAELPVDHREQDNYIGQLGRMLEVDQVKNFSEVGSSISHLQLQLRNAISVCAESIKTCETRAVFFLTGQERFLFFDHRGDFANLTASGYIARPKQLDLRNEFESIYNFYYKKIQSCEADKICLNTNLLALQSICKYYGIVDYYISGWETLDLWPEVDTKRIYKQGQESCANILDLDQNLKHDQHILVSHPSAAGHNLIAETLFKMITNAL